MSYALVRRPPHGAHGTRALLLGALAAHTVFLATPTARATNAEIPTRSDTESARGSTPEPHSASGLNRFFVAGPTPGDPSTGKLITVYGLYALALGSLAVSGVSFFAQRDAQDDTRAFLSDHQNPGPCYELASASCQRLEELRADERRLGSMTALGLGAAGAFLLGGLFTARQWRNTPWATIEPQIAPSAEGASIHVRLQF